MEAVTIDIKKYNQSKDFIQDRSRWRNIIIFRTNLFIYELSN